MFNMGTLLTFLLILLSSYFPASHLPLVGRASYRFSVHICCNPGINWLKFGDFTFAQALVTSNRLVSRFTFRVSAELSLHTTFLVFIFSSLFNFGLGFVSSSISLLPISFSIFSFFEVSFQFSEKCFFLYSRCFFPICHLRF